MSVLTRVKQHQAEQQLSPEQAGQTSEAASSILQAGKSDPPVIQRLRLVLGQITAYVTKNPDHKYARYSWLLDSVMDEVLTDLAERPTPEDIELMGQWFAVFGKLMEWCGSGDDSVLPLQIRDFILRKQPDIMLAITAGTNNETAA